jgi:plastocyanin
MSGKKLKKTIYPLILVAAIGVAGFFAIKTFTEFRNAETYKVVLSSDGFSPALLTVKKGDYVEFTSELPDPFWPASDPHPIHDEFPAFDSKKPVMQGATFKFRFTKPGEFEYHDHLFPAYRGKIVVAEKTGTKLPANRDEIRALVKDRGPEKAYAILKDGFQNERHEKAHTVFHLMGEVLYQEKGLAAFTVCDDAFGFGCYHGFFIKAVSDKGVSVVRELDQKCVEKYGELGLGCTHGIGHGIGEYFSHQDIAGQLELCTDLSWKGELFGCAGGVFMENNFRTSFSDNESSASIRELGEDPLAPCNGIKDRFRKACYFEQASWWKESLGSAGKAGELCSRIQSESHKESCFMGLGSFIVESSGYEADYQKECAQMPTALSEAQCRTGAAWAFFANPGKRSMSESVCAGLGEYENLCLTKRILVN